MITLYRLLISVLDIHGTRHRASRHVSLKRLVMGN